MLLCLLFGGALVIIWLLDLAVWTALSGSLLLVSMYLLTLMRHGWLSGLATRLGPLSRLVEELAYTAEGDWQLRFADGQVHDAELLPSSTVHPKVTTLNFVLRGQSRFRTRRSVVILPDSISKDDFRRLRVLLLSQPPGEKE